MLKGTPALAERGQNKVRVGARLEPMRPLASVRDSTYFSIFPDMYY